LPFRFKTASLQGNLLPKYYKISDGKQVWLAGGMRDAKDALAAFDLGAQVSMFGLSLYDRKTDLQELLCLQKR